MGRGSVSVGRRSSRPAGETRSVARRAAARTGTAVQTAAFTGRALGCGMAHPDSRRVAGGSARNQVAGHAAHATRAILGAVALVLNAATRARDVSAHRGAAGSGVEGGGVAVSGAAHLSGGNVAGRCGRRALRALTGGETGRPDAARGSAVAAAAAASTHPARPSVPRAAALATRDAQAHERRADEPQAHS